MKMLKNLKIATTASALVLALGAAPAMAFVDYSHSAQGVGASATQYMGSGPKSG